MRRANSRGATYPKLLSGRSSFYSSFQAAIFTRASNKFPSQFTFRNTLWLLQQAEGRPSQPVFGSTLSVILIVRVEAESSDYFGNAYTQRLPKKEIILDLFLQQI